MRGYIVTAPTEFLVFAETGVLVAREASLDDAVATVEFLSHPDCFDAADADPKYDRVHS